MNCWKCGHPLDTRERLGFRDTCPSCDWPVHACFNCDFYDPAFHNQCRETQAERVVDKDRANFCEFFAPRTTRFVKASPAAGARGKLEALFKK